MNSMDESESLELFSWYAFKQPIPREGFAHSSKCVVEYCRRIPLLLEIIGSFLSNPSRRVWGTVRHKLVNCEGITKILRISVDDLSDDGVREIFLAIALNLVGMDRDEVIQKLKDRGHSSENGIDVLVQRRLVTVDSKNRIRMHGLVQDCGREIIRENSTGMPEENGMHVLVQPRFATIDSNGIGLRGLVQDRRREIIRENLRGISEERIYDVFLSFRGEDTRARFISHLYTSLQNARINVFRDDNEIQRGDQISVSLLRAIGQSRISIIVLSSNYANSRWCMQELEQIMECGRSRDLVVIPVFYEVNPSEVRHQTGKFGDGFEKLVSGISVDEDEKMNWKTALLEISGIAGFVLINSR
nr:TIR [Medicago truncatula]